MDLKRGILDIQYSKGHDQHYIVLHDSMLEIMRRWAVWGFGQAGNGQHSWTMDEEHFGSCDFWKIILIFFIRTAYNISEQRNLLDLSALLL